jgi:hypothetical protein
VGSACSGRSSSDEEEEQGEHEEESDGDDESPSMGRPSVRPPPEELLECDACGVVGFWWKLARCATCKLHGVHTYCMVRRPSLPPPHGGGRTPHPPNPPGFRDQSFRFVSTTQIWHLGVA